MPDFESIVSLAKRRGFIFPGSEIYGGLAGTWDYGPLGVALKNNLKNLWWRMFVENREDMFGVDAAILMNPKVWEASGHVSGFSDPLGETRFNLMFETKIGAAENAQKIYLRPETAGGIFVNFKNIIDSMHPKIPFGIAQIGKAFRNEIAPRDFIFRAREFEQMEIEYFVRPDDWEKSFEEWRENMLRYIEAAGIDPAKVNELEVPEEERAHYSKRTIDFEFDFPFGRKELYGLAYRTDFDLSAHSESSGADPSYLDEETKEKFIPHVIEPSLGVDRTVLAILCSAYMEDELGGEKRIVLKLKPSIAPVKIAVFPLVRNKPELVSRAREIYAGLKKNIGQVFWDDNGNIGKRYRRQDEIGTPWCVTVDYQTLEDGTVTVRDRDTGEQKRIEESKLKQYFIEKL
ncbi:glycine--tRNA ligase [Candidatus Giovannonibacteria bacterium]|nr:glycine--tRNA ligase [Candidatus Giovannonibacteria bacterium]